MKNKFDDLNSLFKGLEKRVNDASGEVSFKELFNSEFMLANSEFKDIDEFFEGSPFEVEDENDFDSLDERELDKYVKEVTRFSSWEEMKGEAGVLYFQKKMGL